MKKILYIIITLILITAIVFLAIQIKAKLQEDALRFKTEYEELNNERHELSIPENNPMKYIDVKQAVEILKNGTGIMYIGYPKCPSCRLAVPYIIEAAQETKTKKVYYLKITDYNNAFDVQNGEIIKTREEKEGYYELLEEAAAITREYTLHEFENEYIVDEPRIYSPTVLKIENGEITKFKVGAESMPDNEKGNTLLQEYIDIMK